MATGITSNTASSTTYAISSQPLTTTTTTASATLPSVETIQADKKVAMTVDGIRPTFSSYAYDYRSDIDSLKEAKDSDTELKTIFSDEIGKKEELSF